MVLLAYPNKYLKYACKAGYSNIFGYAKNTTSGGPSSILRPLYNIYFCHVTIEKRSQICTRTIRIVFKASALWADAFYKLKCPCICLSVCLFTFEVKFKRLFAPTSPSWMLKKFRDSESLGNSNGKKWSHIWKLLLTKGVKSQRKKVFFYRIKAELIINL